MVGTARSGLPHRVAGELVACPRPGVRSERVTPFPSTSELAVQLCRKGRIGAGITGEAWVALVGAMMAGEELAAESAEAAIGK